MPDTYTTETPFVELTHTACGLPAGGATLSWLAAMRDTGQRQVCMSCGAQGIGWDDVTVASRWSRDWSREP